MKKKKVVKKATKVVTRKGRKPGSKNKVTAAQPVVATLAPETTDKILSVLSHVLDLFKASLYDAFKQYVERKINASLPASLDEFIGAFRHSYKLHGIADHQLLSVLDDYEREYVLNSFSTAKEQVAKNVSAIIDAGVEEAFKTPAAKAEPVKIVPPAPAEPVEAKKEDVSVFDALDLL